MDALADALRGGAWPELTHLCYSRRGEDEAVHFIDQTMAWRNEQRRRIMARRNEQRRRKLGHKEIERQAAAGDEEARELLRRLRWAHEQRPRIFKWAPW